MRFGTESARGFPDDPDEDELKDLLEERESELEDERNRWETVDTVAGALWHKSLTTSA